MFALIRMPRAEVLAALEEDADVAVSPTSATGWTALLVGDAELVPVGAPALFLDAPDETGTVAVRPGDRWEILAPDDTMSADVRRRTPSEPDTSRELLVATLGLATDAADALVALLAAEPDVDELVAALGSAVEIDDPLPPAPRRAMVLARLPERRMRAAGGIVAGTGVAVEFTDLDDGWTALLPTDDAERSEELAVGVGMTLRAGNIVVRRRRALLLWRGDRDVHGAIVFRGDEAVGSMTWGSPWKEPGTEGWQIRDRIAEEFVPLAARDSLDLPRLRALFRSDAPAGDPLVELSEILSLPASTVPALDAAAEAPPTEPVSPVGFWRFLWAWANGGGPTSDVPVPWLIGLGVVSLLVASVAVVMTVMKIAVIATDGAFVDEPGSSSVSDWVFAALFSVGALAYLGAAIAFFRGARRSGRHR